MLSGKWINVHSTLDPMNESFCPTAVGMSFGYGTAFEVEMNYERSLAQGGVFGRHPFNFS